VPEIPGINAKDAMTTMQKIVENRDEYFQRVDDERTNISILQQSKRLQRAQVVGYDRVDCPPTDEFR